MSLISISPHLGCEVNLPLALRGDSLHRLPPYAKVPAYCADDYPACPDSWMRGSAKEGSFFVGVKAGHGLWLDFNSCWQHTHHVAVLLSIQGINPVTGKPLAGVKLEQFHDKCPAHGTAFQGGRFCPYCGYKWPAQNYLSTTGLGGGRLWLDGFRGDDGEVRQYVFTEETARGVAAQILGDLRVFAIGVSFFLSVEPKPAVKFSSVRSINSQLVGGSYAGGGNYSAQFGSVLCCNTVKGRVADDASVYACSAAGDMEVCESADTTQLEIAAGARIDQDTGEDRNPLSFWRDTPESTLFINYLPENEVKKILLAGQRATKKDGALAGLRVGN